MRMTRMNALCLTLALMFVSSVAGADCDKCFTYPPLCGDVVNCIKSCGIEKKQALDCLESNYIDRARYIEATGEKPPWEDPCYYCGKYPQMCKTIGVCMKDCKAAKESAEDCYYDKLLDGEGYTKATGEPVPQMTAEQHQACKEKCRSAAAICEHLALCVPECGASSETARKCLDEGKVDRKTYDAVMKPKGSRSSKASSKTAKPTDKGKSHTAPSPR